MGVGAAVVEGGGVVVWAATSAERSKIAVETVNLARECMFLILRVELSR
jgi:hypothetical protein